MFWFFQMLISEKKKLFMTNKKLDFYFNWEILLKKIRRFLFGKFVKTCRELVIRRGAACVAYNDQIYVIGGKDDQIYDSVEFFNPATNEWSFGPSLQGNIYLRVLSSSLDNFQDFLTAYYMKPWMLIVDIIISSLKHVIVRPTKIFNKLCKASTEYIDSIYILIMLKILVGLMMTWSNEEMLKSTICIYGFMC